jgi:hypothetical protein
MEISNFTSVICLETVKCAESLTYSSGLTINESNSAITRGFYCAGIESLGFDQYWSCAGTDTLSKFRCGGKTARITV